ncbi:DUF2938 domain-containing protein [Affinibrenneria salicis]|uniref:DUF2938 domain-containing protein n=1 Tax=Affinibrenneria salicis TaxID=2590031 RepID=A0A5J5FXH8_9GAMM|nr:DUF2938 domain-containing protein [Affinibrenneria salicis]KAA8998443.1 DUF2938 domain-containing protein [Affinibrenneria salicis]
MMDDILYRTLLIGVGATLTMDGWAWLQRRLFGIPALDYALVGRWFCLMGRGQFVHRDIRAGASVRYERAAGWLIHYITGIFFAALLVWSAGPSWLDQPTLLPALLLGLFSVGAPFLIMQPALGFGLAASKTPQPAKARVRSLIAHLSFGVGLYLATQIAALASVGVG